MIDYGVKNSMQIKFGNIVLLENTQNMGIKILAFYFIIYPIMIIFKEHIKYWYFIFGIPFSMFIFIYVYGKKISRNKFLGVMGIFLIYSLFSLMTGYMDKYIYNWMGMFLILFIYCFPWFILTLVENEWLYFADIICGKTILMFLTTLILYAHDLIMGVSMNGNMQFSYAAMPVIIFSLYDFFEKKHIYQLIISIILFIMIVLFGSRGPLICIMFFLLLYFMKNRKKQLPIIMILLFTMFVLISNYERIIKVIAIVLDKYSISSRTIYKLMSGTITSNTGRDKIQDIVIQLISQKFLTGIGIGGERIVINKEIYNMTKNMGACYPHNIILEVLVQYGILIGGTLIIWFVAKCIMVYVGNSNKRNALIILISISIVHLMVSSSYLEEPMFFALLGMIMNTSSPHNNQQYTTS